MTFPEGNGAASVNGQRYGRSGTPLVVAPQGHFESDMESPLVDTNPDEDEFPATIAQLRIPAR
jgi:hypothetical protein